MSDQQQQQQQASTSTTQSSQPPPPNDNSPLAHLKAIGEEMGTVMKDGLGGPTKIHSIIYEEDKYVTGGGSKEKKGE
jgi:hypothetical protein